MFSYFFIYFHTFVFTFSKKYLQTQVFHIFLFHISSHIPNLYNQQRTSRGAASTPSPTQRHYEIHPKPCEYRCLQGHIFKHPNPSPHLAFSKHQNLHVIFLKAIKELAPKPTQFFFENSVLLQCFQAKLLKHSLKTGHENFVKNHCVYIL